MSSNRSLKPDQIAERIENIRLRGIKCLDNPVNMKNSHSWKCLKSNCGHEWTNTFTHIYSRKQGCPKCAGRFDEYSLNRLKKGFKNCSKCNLEKSVDKFYKSKKEACGYESQCKECSAKQSKLRREKIKETINTEGKLTPKVLYKKCTKCKQTKLSSEFSLCMYTTDKLRSHCNVCKNADQRIYNKINIGDVVYRTRLRETRKVNATPKWANLQAIKEIYRECQRLNRKTGIKHHVDHIIPLKNDLVCGLHVENNLQIITAKENFSKGNKFTPYVESKLRK
jgi:hypothetical protein